MTDRLLTLGPNSGRPGTKIKPVGVVVHYVGNPGSSAEANRNYFETGGTGASSHYIVGLNGEVLRLIPEDEKSNSAGKAYGNFTSEQVKDNNIKYISIETCHPDATGKFSTTTYTALIALIADICKRYGWSTDKVVRHYDICGKSCPLYYVNNRSAWEALKADVSKMLGGTPAVPSPQSKTPIMGTAKATAAQMKGYLLSKNPAAPDYAAIYISEGLAEGVRGDIAFAQSCLETGNFKFGGDVKASQNNFAGLGATGGGNSGNVFKTPQEGIRAQIQHLKAYASMEPLKQACADQRYNAVKSTYGLGSAPNVEDLTGTWAKDTGYAPKILKVLADIESFAAISYTPQRVVIKADSVVTINKGAVYGGAARGKAVPSEQLVPKKHTVVKIQVNAGVSEALLKEINSYVPVSSLTAVTS